MRTIDLRSLMLMTPMFAIAAMTTGCGGSSPTTANDDVGSETSAVTKQPPLLKLTNAQLVELGAAQYDFGMAITTTDIPTTKEWLAKAQTGLEACCYTLDPKLPAVIASMTTAIQASPTAVVNDDGYTLLAVNYDADVAWQLYSATSSSRTASQPTYLAALPRPKKTETTHVVAINPELLGFHSIFVDSDVQFEILDFKVAYAVPGDPLTVDYGPLHNNSGGYVVVSLAALPMSSITIEYAEPGAVELTPALYAYR
jgi:hypothetical protein